MSPQKQLRIVEVVKIIDRIAGAELDPLDLLEINIINLLSPGCYAAKPDPVKGFL